MVPRKHEVVWALIGNLVIGAGAGTLVLAAFIPSLPVGPDNFVVRTLAIAVGYGVFFAGYHITQAGTYRDTDEPLVRSLLPSTTAGDGETTGTVNALVALRASVILLGVLGLAAGMRLFALTIDSWDPTVGVLAGVVTIVGYVFGHIGMNWALI